MKTIRDIMIAAPKTLPEDATVGDAIAIFSKTGYGCLPIVNAGGQLTAFLSDGDIISFLSHRLKRSEYEAAMLHQKGDRTQADEKVLAELAESPVAICATHRVASISVDASLEKAASLMDDKLLKHLPVVDADDRIVGLLSRKDLTLSLFDDYVARK